MTDFIVGHSEASVSPSRVPRVPIRCQVQLLKASKTKTRDLLSVSRQSLLSDEFPHADFPLPISMSRCGLHPVSRLTGSLPACLPSCFAKRAFLGSR